MKRTLLARLQRNGNYYTGSALLFLVGVPLYQWFLLTPLGYGNALNAIGTGHFSAYLIWISNHSVQFIGYRALLISAFALLLTLPFSLFRIIVAQEIIGQQEQMAEEQEESTSRDIEDEEQEETDGMPPYAWRGKGFAVIAAWSGLLGLILTLVGTIGSTLYLLFVSNGFTASTAIPGSFPLLASIFSIATNTAGIGLLALATLFFGALITRSGRNLWPMIWVAFGYTALAVAALLSGSAVASTTTEGQAALTSPAILLFALWVLWLAIMLIRLKPE